MRLKTFRRLAVELLVVVFGILIAVAVDRWNQDRQDRATAAQYVEALAADIAADTAVLGSLTQLYKDREVSAQRVRDALERPTGFQGDPAALAWNLKYASYVTSFDPNDFTYRELVSTGGLGLIESADLKRTLVAYYQNVEFLGQFYPLWQETALAYYRPEVRSRVTPADWIAIETSRESPVGDARLSESSLEALRRDGVVEKLLASMVSSLEEQATAHESLRANAIELLGLLNAR